MTSAVPPSDRTPTGYLAVLLDRQGIVRPLAWGYAAITLFMVGDGMELGFLAPFLDSRGIGPADVGTLFTVYGLTVAVAAWLAGALAEAVGPRRVMLIGFVIWAVLEVVFLLGLRAGNFPLMVLAYGIRGFGYPFFAYGFLVWVTLDTPHEKLGRAVGWYWFASTAGLGVISAYLAGGLIPIIGELATLWVSLGFVVAGGLIAALLVHGAGRRRGQGGLRDLGKVVQGLSVVKDHPKVGLGGVVRIINTLSFYAFGVFLTTHMVREVGFSTPAWQTIWGTMLLANIVGNLASGYLADRIGQVTVVAWGGGVGCAVTVLGLYYVPAALGANFAAVITIAALYGLALAAYVPLSAIMPMLAPRQKASAVAILNLGAGLSNFLGPLLTRVFLGPLGVSGMMWLFAGIYLVGILPTLALRPPRGADRTRPAPRRALHGTAGSGTERGDA